MLQLVKDILFGIKLPSEFEFGSIPSISSSTYKGDNILSMFYFVKKDILTSII